MVLCLIYADTTSELQDQASDSVHGAGGLRDLEFILQQAEGYLEDIKTADFREPQLKGQEQLE